MVKMQSTVLVHHIIAMLSLVTNSKSLEFVPKHLQDPSLQVHLQDGRVQGQLKTGSNNITYYAFEGIPYAKPPIGELRFRNPQPPDKWSAILNANGNNPSCIQIPPSTDKNWNESEDCLYVNVYKRSSSTSGQPVMAWIHGGGFLFGLANSTYYGPDHLLAKDVIVVHFNYRVNVFGFLATGDTEAPGNYGLKDQLLALKWIRGNIDKFGGDPSRVTIFGESAGGASVIYHLLSPLSRRSGLYHRAIAESGSPLCAWAFQSHPLPIVVQLGQASGYTMDTSSGLMRHLRSLSTRQLKRAAISVSIVNSVNIAKALPFGPSIEPEDEEAFISGNSFDKLKRGDFSKVPLIIGYNSLEAAIIEPIFEKLEPLLHFLITDQILIPPALKLRSGSVSEVGSRIRDFYYRSNNKSPTQQRLEFISDSYFYRPILETARLYAIHAPVYLYRFSYSGYFLGKRAFAMGEDSNISGVMHAEEVWYIFSRDDLERANDADRLVRARMVTMWSNFAKYGNPTPPTTSSDLLQQINWPRFDSDSYAYLDIDSNLTVLTNPKDAMMHFWAQLFAEYGREPYDTY